MLHVKQIQSLADNGEADQAHEALDQLLALGPKNTEALKIRATLLANEGRFEEEGQTWQRVAQVDPEDEDAVHFLLQRQIEEREHFYFTDDIPGGKRFIAYPKKLIRISMAGLLGCLVFLISTRLTQVLPNLADPVVTLGLFCILVLIPWLLIVVTFFKSLKWIVVTAHSVTVATRIKTHELIWSEVDRIYLAHSYQNGVPPLALVIVPTAKDEASLQIDLSRTASSIRARIYLIDEIARLFRKPEFARRENIDLKDKKIKSF